MAFTNFASKEINCKVVYFGPPGAGKTENLRAILAQTSDDLKTGRRILDEASKPTPFFDFLPLSLGYVKDFHLKLHLYSLSLAAPLESLPRLVLRGLDGFVFVADSRIASLQENVLTLAQVHCRLQEEGYALADLAQVVQYNKRDLPDCVGLDILRRELNLAKVPEQEAVANTGRGALETLRALVHQILLSPQGRGGGSPN